MIELHRTRRFQIFILPLTFRKADLLNSIRYRLNGRLLITVLKKNINIAYHFHDRWEGFIQVALCCWDQKQKVYPDAYGDTVSGSLHVMSVNLLHIAIKQLGNVDPALRKACLVGAFSPSSSSEGWLGTNQRTLFWHLISKINNELKFSDALKLLEEAVQKHEDPLDQVRWVKDLIFKEEVKRSQMYSTSDTDNGCGFHILCNHRERAETVFMEVKSKFWKEIVFEEVEQCYKVMLEKYRKVRKQYTDGMLSLHCITGDS